MNEDEFLRMAEEIAFQTAYSEEAQKAKTEEMWLEIGKQLYSVFSNFQKAGFSKEEALNLTSGFMNMLFALNITEDNKKK